MSNCTRFVVSASSIRRFPGRRTLRQLGLQVGEKLGEQKADDLLADASSVALVMCAVTWAPVQVSDGFIYVVNVSLDPLLSGCLTWTMTPGDRGV